MEESTRIYNSVLSKPLIMLLMKVLISITKSALFQNAAELNDSGASKLNYRHFLPS
jgi:hypothetical protein